MAAYKMLPAMELSRYFTNRIRYLNCPISLKETVQYKKSFETKINMLQFIDGPKYTNKNYYISYIY